MRKVDIYYNPYLCRTTLTIDGNVLKQEENRLCEFMEGKPLEAWLDYHVISYQLWEGAVLELMKELNDDELDITFWGLPEDYQRFIEAAEEQKDVVRSSGFDPDSYKTKYQPRFKPEFVKKNVQTFLENKNTAVVGFQKAMLDMEFLGMYLEEMEEVTVKEMQDAKSSLMDILKKILDYHKKEKDSLFSQAEKLKEEKIIEYWKRAVWELEKIYM